MATPTEQSSSVFSQQATAGAAVGGSASDTKCWLDLRHRTYTKHIDLWRFTRDMYTGECAWPDNVKAYLVKKAYGESTAAFLERSLLADYPNHFAAIVDSLSGMLAKTDEDATRTYNILKPDGTATMVMGDPDDRTSLIGRLLKDADGQGTNMATLVKQMTGELVSLHRAWGLVDSEDGVARVRYFGPECVVNWLDDGSQVLVMEQSDTRTSLQVVEELEERYVLYTLTGWSRWKKEAKTQTAIKLEEGSYTFVTADNKPRLPIFSVQIPVKRFVGYAIASRVHKLFNKKSERDFLLRVANFPRLGVVGDEAHFDKVTSDLADGANAMHNLPELAPHYFIAPPVESATIATAVLDSDTRDIYIGAHRDYGDAAAQKTATEATQDVAAGAGAFLELLATALDEFENTVYPLCLQIEKPRDRANWFVPQVKRSSEFMPVDDAAKMEAQTVRAFGAASAVPLGAQGRVVAAKQWAAFNNIDISDEQLEAEVQSSAMLTFLESVKDLQIPIPAELMTAIVVRMAAAHGFVDAKDAMSEEVQDAGELLSALDLAKKVADLSQGAEDAATQARQSLLDGAGNGDSETETPAKPPVKKAA